MPAETLEGLTLVEVLEYEGVPLEVLEAQGERWVAAARVESALGVRSGTVVNLVRRHSEEFEGFVREVHGGVSVVTTETRPSGRRAILYLNFKGVIGAILKINRKRVTKPEVREAILAFRRWALETLEAVMRGEPVGPAGPAPVGASLDPSTDLAVHYLHVIEALGRNAHNLEAAVLVPLAAAVGIAMDPELIFAERAQRDQATATRDGGLALAAQGGDLVARFLSDAAAGVVIATDLEVGKAAIYQRFVAWCTAHGMPPLSRTMFNRGLARQARVREHHAGRSGRNGMAGRYWRGIGLRPVPDGRPSSAPVQTTTA